MPTMLQAAGLEVPAEVQGESLLGRMKAGADQASDDSWRDRPAYAQADYPHLAYGWSALQSLRTGKYLYVQAPRRELYDEAGDQKAEHNLAPEMKAVADTVGDQLESFRKKTSSQREAPKMTEDPAAQEKLAALGYVMSTNAAKAAANGPGADPKDSENIETVKGLRKADLLIKGRHFADAVPVLQQVIARNPSISILYFKLGDSYVNLHQYDKAVPALRQAVELDPNNRKARWDLGASLVEVQDFAAAASAFEKILPKEPNARNPEIPILYAKLGHCYLKLHQYDKAVPTLRQAVELAPTSSGAMLDLGAALVEVQDFAAAAPELAEAVALLCMRPSTAAAACQREIEQYNQTLENNPDAYAANLLLGSALLLSGDAAAAVPKLEKAAALQLKMPEPHTLLADAYLQLGQKAEADQERAEAARLGASGKE
jgi:Flp pilus assembly protein TadD